MIQELLPQAQRIAARLRERGETVAVAESSTGGIISAALLAVAGASAYFMGGAVVYTRQSRRALLDIPEEALAGIRPSTEDYALLFARAVRQSMGTTWALGETGATGPTGNRYGDAAGHSCIALVGPSDEKAITVETRNDDRVDNMRAFTVAALNLLEKSLG
ncbi:MAG TPA: CinA family protein [Stellaceae bacterium]|nr:CinA family protein [Stellaceae bacterium]